MCIELPEAIIFSDQEYLHFKYIPGSKNGGMVCLKVNIS